MFFLYRTHIPKLLPSNVKFTKLNKLKYQLGIMMDEVLGHPYWNIAINPIIYVVIDLNTNECKGFFSILILMRNLKQNKKLFSPTNNVPLFKQLSFDWHLAYRCTLSTLTIRRNYVCLSHFKLIESIMD